MVVIAGGSDGLGKAIARRLAAEYRVVILSPSEEKLKAAAEEIGCSYRVCDVGDYGQCAAAVKRIIEDHGRIDFLINSAGVWIEGELADNNPAMIERTIRVNTLGTIFMTRAVVGQMKERKSGVVVNIISRAGLYAKPLRSIYNASKWAVTGFTKCLEEELADYGIKVVGVYPGMMKTNLFAKAGATKDMSKALDPDKVARVVEFVVETEGKTEILGVELKNIDY